jgi:outer membrane autotransporter protein
VAVKGNADLNAKLVIFSLGGFHPSAGNEFEVLSTGGTVSGNFSLLDDSQFNINPTIPGKLKVKPFEVADKNGVLLVYETSEEEVVQLLNPTAEQLTALFEIPFSGANIQRFNLDDRMFQIQRSYVPPPFTFDFFTACRGVWANGGGEFGNVDDPGLAKGYRFTTGDMSAGVDDRLTDHLAVGLFGGYSHTWTDFRPGNADVDTGRGGLYATYFEPTGWWVNTGVWGGYNSYSTSRQGLLGPVNGSTDGYEVSTFGDAGYNFHCGDLVWGPLVAMQYTDAHVSGFSEHGSLVPMDVHSNSQDSLRTDVGAQASYSWHLGKTIVIPGLKLAWEHEYRYSNLDITGSVPALNNASATFNGPNLGHDSLIIQANVGIQIIPQIAATIGYDGQLGRDHYISNAVTGTFSYSF